MALIESPTKDLSVDELIEVIKSFEKKGKKHNNFTFDPFAEREKEYKYHIPNEPLGGIEGMKPDNLCVLDSGGMSECSATSIKESHVKLTTQEKCPFFKKAKFASRCRFETFKQFCWSTEAQDDANS